MPDFSTLERLVSNKSDAKAAVKTAKEALEYVKETGREMDQWLTREPTRYSSADAETKLTAAERACETFARTLKSEDPLARPFSELRETLQRAKIDLRTMVGEVISSVNGLEASAASRVKDAAAAISNAYTSAERAQVGLMSLVAEALRAKTEKRPLPADLRAKVTSIQTTVAAALKVANDQRLTHSGYVGTFVKTRERLEKYVGKRVDTSSRVDATFPEKARQAVERLEAWKDDIDRKLEREFA
jgi:hypothetical protein